MAAVTPSPRYPSSDLPPPPPGLPAHMVESAAARIAWLAPVAAGVIVCVQTFQAIAQPALREVVMTPASRLATVAAILMGLGIFALHRYKVVRPPTIVAFGVVFEIVVAFCISMIETTIPLGPTRRCSASRRSAPWILAVGVFIPNRPGRTLADRARRRDDLAARIRDQRAHAGLRRRSRSAQLIVWPFFNYLLAGARVPDRPADLRHDDRRAQTAVELGSYRLVAPIGEGGMGEVWKASHQMLARAAAIKLVRPQMRRDRRGRRTSRPSASSARPTSSPACSRRTRSISTTSASPQDGRFYYVMELLDGISLQTLVTTFGPQPAGRVLAILRHACRSLEEAHQQGLVHRDLKPSNMMICKVGAALRLRQGARLRPREVRRAARTRRS